MTYKVKGNNLDRVYVNGFVNVGGDENHPSLLPARDIPLREFILDNLRKDLLQCDGLLAVHFDYVFRSMQNRLEDKYYRYNIALDDSADTSANQPPQKSI